MVKILKETRVIRSASDVRSNMDLQDVEINIEEWRCYDKNHNMVEYFDDFDEAIWYAKKHPQIVEIDYWYSNKVLPSGEIIYDSDGAVWDSEDGIL